jgi:hypothetical protein
MKEMEKKEIIELLKSGKFTVAYHDFNSPSLYKGKHRYENLKDSDEVKLYGWENGYCPYIVSLLVKALGGTSDSI